MKSISYVFPIYNEEENIDRLYTSMCAVFDKIKNEYKLEVIFINDGSTDSSILKLKDLQSKDKRVTVLDFSRNFGHQYAITAGIDYSHGDAVIIMDSDLQDPPAVSLDLISKWEEGFDVVYAQRRSRKDTIFKKFTAFLFYRTLEALANIQIPKDTGDFRLIDRRVADTIKSFRESNRFMRGMVSYVGYKQTSVMFDRGKRMAGKTNYPLKKMIKLAMDGITSFSTIPLRLITQLGFLVSFFSFLGVAYALTVKLFFPQIVVSGWAMLIISVLFIGGIQLIMLGIIGTYIGRIYSEVQERPLYIVSNIYTDKK